VFDLDCTAQVRPGLLGLMDIGPLFLENRYTKRPVYLPHHTLKNLWDLSHLIDPVRLRMEFNNPDTNHDNYDGSPLCHGRYRPDALFATVMAASPLAWMELSDVSEASVAAIAPLVKRWKEERARWHGGVIHPVANRPDGVAWTGFVSEAADGKGGYVLLFRELNASERFTLDLAPIFGARPLTVEGVIGGRGEAKLDGAALSVTVPEKLDFVWVKLGE
jgi:alpha-galactosidase